MRFELSKIENSELPEQVIKRVSNFSELYEALDRVCPLKGSQGVYSSDELIDIINRVREKELPIEYVTRTYGLREKVSELLNKSPAPNDHPPSEAAVALEIPRSEHEVPGSKFDEPTESPDGPDPSGAGAQVEYYEDTKQERVTMEKNPVDPIIPLTEEEQAFYNQAKIEEGQRFSDNYRMNVESAPDRYLNLNDPEVQKRYEVVAGKVELLNSLDSPKSLESLYEVLKTHDLETEDRVMDGEELMLEIEQVLSGNTELGSLPEILQTGLTKIIARQVQEKLQNINGSELKLFEWECFLRVNPPHQDFLGNRNIISYPRLGERGVLIKEGDLAIEIEGELVWANNDVIIVKDGEHYKSFSTQDIVMGNGKTLLENQGVGSRRQSDKQYLQREIPRS